MKIILALRQCPEGRGRSSTNHPVFQVLGHGTRVSAHLHRASLTGLGSLVTCALLTDRTGLDLRGPGPGPPGLGDPLSMLTSQNGCSPPYPLWSCLCFSSASFYPLLEWITSQYLNEVCSWL